MESLRRTAARPSVRLLAATVAALLFVEGESGRHAIQAQAGPNPVSVENNQDGDTGWDIAGAGDNDIQGFATDISVNVGDTVHFKIAAPGATAYTLDIYRLGYYRGAGARKVASVSPSASLPQTQPACVSDNVVAGTGLIDCGNWAESASWTVPLTMVSGIYIAKPTRPDLGHTSHIVFIVRDDARTANVLFQTSDTTWQAYNQWPGVDNGAGGASLYCGGPLSNTGTDYSCQGRAAKVSYNRPFDTRGHDPQSFLFNAEYPMVRWLEANGYDVKYWSGVDTDRRAADLTAHKPNVILSVGHDEYWSAGQRASVEAARNAGVSLAFFSGNEMFWKTRYEPSMAMVSTVTSAGSIATVTTAAPHPFATGDQVAIAGASPSAYNGTYTITVTGASTFTYAFSGGSTPATGTVTATATNPNRTLVAYKDTLGGTKLDPLSGVTTGTWRDTRFAPPIADGGRPENAVTGNIWTVNSGSAAMTVPSSMANLRFWRNTRIVSLTDGQVATLADQSVGYEWDEDLDNGFRPAGVVHLSSTRVGGVQKILDFGAKTGTGTATHTLTLYRHNTTSGNVTASALVFGAGTVQWSWGLDGNHDRGGSIPDRAMQQATVNLLADMGAQPATLQVGVDPGHPIVAATQSTDTFAPNATITSPNSPTGVVSIQDGSGVTIRGTAVDNGGAVAGVEVSVDGLTWHPADGGTTAGTFSWSYVWFPGSASATPVTIRARAIDDSGNIEDGTTSSHITVDTSACACSSLWDGSPLPFMADDPSAVELGVKFYSEIDGNITGLRFFKAAANTGTHVGHLWATDSTLLASATFTSETAQGWQEVTFAHPVAVTAGTIYIASYHTDVGEYAATGGFFANAGLDAPPLHAPASSAVGGNGVFAYGSGSFPSQSFNATNYWVAPVFGLDRTPPVISNVSANIIDSSQVAITWQTDEPSTSKIDYSTDPTFVTLTQSQSDSAFVMSHSITLRGLTPYNTYYYRVTSTSRTGVPSIASAPSFTVPGPTLRDTAPADFNAGTGTNTYVSETGDGELILAPAFGTEFSGSALPTNWTTVPWVAGGTAAVGGGRLSVDGASLSNPNLAGPGSSIEFAGTFSVDTFEHVGFSQFADFSGAYAIFSTFNSTADIFARTSDGSYILIPGVARGSQHRFRIDWNATNVMFWVDGTLRATLNSQLTAPMMPTAASDVHLGGGAITVDWLRLAPYGVLQTDGVTRKGTFVSRVFDAGSPVAWHGIQWVANTPANTSLAIAVRTSQDGTAWTSYAPVTPGALNVTSQYIQYQATLTTTDPNVTPDLDDIIISVDHAPTASAVSATTNKNVSFTFPAAGPGSLLAGASDLDPSDVLHLIGVTQPAHGTARLNGDGSVTYTPALDYTGSDTFTYTVSDGLLKATANVNMTVLFVDSPPVAVDDQGYVVDQNTVLNVPAPGVLANDTDVDRDPLTARLVTPPSHGTVALGGDGSFTYTPSSGYAGTDSFTYQAFDGTLAGNAATVSILVNAVRPNAFGNDYVMLENACSSTDLSCAPSTLTVSAPGVLADDQGTTALTAVLVDGSGPAHGALAFRSDGSFTYTPETGFVGEDDFQYQAVDAFNRHSLNALVRIAVMEKLVTGAVSANGGTVTTDPAGTGTTAVDPVQTAVATTTASNVSIYEGAIAASQALVGYTFLDRQVNISITNADGSDVTASLANPITLTFALDASLVPVDAATGLPVAAGAIVIFRNGAIAANCTPFPFVVDGTTPISSDPCVARRATDASGNITFTVLTTHASVWNVGISNTVSGRVTSARDDSYTTPQGAALTMKAPGVLGNDFGPKSLSAGLVVGPSHGTLSLGSAGNFVYTPDPTFYGADTFMYQASDGSNSDQATVTIHVKATPATITWNAPADIVYGTALGISQLNATANVPGSFAYTPTAGTVLSAGTNQTLSVSFTPTDAANYATTTKSVTINVLKATPTITWSNPADITYGTALSATQLNATTSVAGSWTYTPALGATPNAGNAQTLSVSFTPTDATNYNAATKSVTINVLKATPTITWSNPADITYGTALSATQLNATTSVPGSWTYSPALGATLNAGNAQTLSVSFTPTNATNYNAATKSVTINVLKATPVISWKPTDIVDGTALTASQLNATANVAGTFAYSPPLATVISPRGTKLLSVSFTPNDTVDYTTASASVTINVLDAPPVAASQSVNAGTANARAVTLMATDYEHDPLTFTIVNGPSRGTLSGTAPNVTYTSNTGYVGSDSFTFKANDGVADSNTATVTINVITPITTTTASTISVLSVQYSDQDTFTATITPASSFSDPPATMINFKVGTEIVGTAPLTLSNGVYSTTWTGQMIEVAGQPTGQMKPGSKVMTAALADPTGLYTVSFANKSMTMTKEDARVAYSGQSTLKVQADGTVTLLASVKDITAVTGDPAWDNYPGDIRNAQVSFVDRSTNTILGTVNVALSGTDPTIGTATYVWTPSLGTATSKTYSIGFIVTNYYNRNNTLDNATVTVTK